MATYTHYWPEWACDDARALGLVGHPVPVFFGGQNADSNFNRFKVGPGDTVVAVTVVKGELLLLASLRVTSKTTTGAWLALNPGHVAYRFSGDGGQALGGTPGAVLDFDRVVSPALLGAWRYDSGKTGRALKDLEGGKLMRALPVRGVYRLTEPTAKQVDTALARATDPAPNKPRDLEQLERALRERPENPAAAAVLADAWQEHGDPRGELLSLELALATAAPEAASALWTKLDALVRKRSHAPALKQPGGFPFRAWWGQRPYVVWSFHARLSQWPTFAAWEARVASWATLSPLVLTSREPLSRRPLSLEEARVHSFGSSTDELRLSVRARFPATGVELPFQTKHFLPPNLEQLSLLPHRIFGRCVLPLVDDGPLLRALLAEARGTLPPLDPAKEQLTLFSWEGRTQRQVPLPLR